MPRGSHVIKRAIRFIGRIFAQILTYSVINSENLRDKLAEMIRSEELRLRSPRLITSFMFRLITQSTGECILTSCFPCDFSRYLLWLRHIFAAVTVFYRFRSFWDYGSKRIVANRHERKLLHYDESSQRLQWYFYFQLQVPAFSSAFRLRYSEHKLQLGPAEFGFHCLSAVSVAQSARAQQ